MNDVDPMQVDETNDMGQQAQAMAQQAARDALSKKFVNKAPGRKKQSRDDSRDGGHNESDGDERSGNGNHQGDGSGDKGLQDAGGGQMQSDAGGQQSGANTGGTGFRQADLDAKQGLGQKQGSGGADGDHNGNPFGGDKSGNNKVVKNVKRSAKAADFAGKTALGIKLIQLGQLFLQFVTNLIGSAVAMVAGGLGAIWGSISAIGSAIGSFVSSAAAVVSSALGITATAASVVVVGTAIAGTGGVAVIAGALVISLTAAPILDGGLVADCRDEVVAAVDSGTVDDTNASMDNNAKDVYAILAPMGLSKAQVGGILSNMQAEGSIDPTAVEGVFDEPYVVGEKKTDALNNHDSYTSRLIEGYVSSGVSINRQQYVGSDGSLWPGVGLFQWTPATRLLDPAKAAGVSWYSIDYQLAYLLARGTPTGALGGKNWINEYKSATSGMSPRDCASEFTKAINGSMPGNQVTTHIQYADSWATKAADWSGDDMRANSVLQLANKLGADATNTVVKAKQDLCTKTCKSDNSTAANAAVAYAYETKEEGEGNNGTALYQKLHDAIFPGDPYYQSCDRGVAVAVRWSGTDITYPVGATPAQLSYLRTSDKWTKVGTSDTVSMDDLMPGDVFILDGHTFMYVGNEAVRKVYPNSSGDSVSASYNERSPGVGNDASSLINDNGGMDWSGRGAYEIYRCTKPDKSDMYANAGASSSVS